jgi:hypothetical protein
LVLHADTFFGDGPAAADPGRGARGWGFNTDGPGHRARTGPAAEQSAVNVAGHQPVGGPDARYTVHRKVT